MENTIKKQQSGRMHSEISNVFSKLRRLKPNERYCHKCKFVYLNSEKCKCENDILGGYPLYQAFTPTH